MKLSKEMLLDIKHNINNKLAIVELAATAIKKGKDPEKYAKIILESSKVAAKYIKDLEQHAVS